MITAMIRMLRPKHWVKNVLVFLPIAFGGGLANPASVVSSLLGFFVLCAAASSVYVVNDLRDIEADRRDPVKRLRPIASGEVPARFAAICAGALFLISLVLNVLAVGVNLAALSLVVLYIAMNMAYSLGLKHVPIADIAVLASGYLIRVLYGSVLSGVEISSWLYLTVLSLSFYLGLGKRKGELDAAAGGPVRPVVEKYPTEFLSQNMTVFFALGLVFYSLWATGTEMPGAMPATIPLVFVICLRYSLVMGSAGRGDPIEVFYGDKPLIALIVAFAAIVLGIVYAG